VHDDDDELEYETMPREGVHEMILSPLPGETMQECLDRVWMAKYGEKPKMANAPEIEEAFACLDRQRGVRE
jgi:hypothetical protein